MCEGFKSFRNERRYTWKPLEYNKLEGAGGVVQGGEHLPSMWEAFWSIANAITNKNQKQILEFGWESGHPDPGLFTVGQLCQLSRETRGSVWGTREEKGQLPSYPSPKRHGIPTKKPGDPSLLGEEDTPQS